MHEFVRIFELLQELPDSRSKKTLATKFEVCYIIDIKRAAAHKGLTDNEDSNATRLPTKVSGWLLLCKATYKR